MVFRRPQVEAAVVGPLEAVLDPEAGRLEIDAADGKAILTPIRAVTASDLMGVVYAERHIDIHEARRDYARVENGVGYIDCLSS